MGRSSQEPRPVGIDVSSGKLDVAIGGVDEVKTFENSPKGHKALVRMLTKGGRSARVVVEATSTYHLDLAIALAQAARCEVMVANPRTTKHFHQAQNRRAKTDKVDARSLCDFAAKMDFVPWRAPAKNALELRALGRHLARQIKHQTRLKNQLHAAKTSSSSPVVLLEELESELESVAARIKRIKDAMLEIARADEHLSSLVDCLDSAPGLGTDTAVLLLSEFLFLDREMTAKELTAWAGLDPMPRESGTSLLGKRRISKRGNARVRAALYMPALAASRVKGTPTRALYQRVHSSTKVRMKGVTAVMRKLLVVSWALYRTNQPWDATKAVPARRESEAAA